MTNEQILNHLSILRTQAVGIVQMVDILIDGVRDTPDEPEVQTMGQSE